MNYGLRSSAIWRRLTGWLVSDVSTQHVGLETSSTISKQTGDPKNRNTAECRMFVLYWMKYFCLSRIFIGICVIRYCTVDFCILWTLVLFYFLVLTFRNVTSTACAWTVLLFYFMSLFTKPIWADMPCRFEYCVDYTFLIEYAWLLTNQHQAQFI